MSNTLRGCNTGVGEEREESSHRCSRCGHAGHPGHSAQDRHGAIPVFPPTHKAGGAAAVGSPLLLLLLQALLLLLKARAPAKPQAAEAGVTPLLAQPSCDAAHGKASRAKDCRHQGEAASGVCKAPGCWVEGSGCWPARRTCARAMLHRVTNDCQELDANVEKCSGAALEAHLVLTLWRPPRISVVPACL